MYNMFAIYINKYLLRNKLYEVINYAGFPNPRLHSVFLKPKYSPSHFSFPLHSTRYASGLKHDTAHTKQLVQLGSVFYLLESCLKVNLEISCWCWFLRDFTVPLLLTAHIIQADTNFHLSPLSATACIYLT